MCMRKCVFRTCFTKNKELGGEKIKKRGEGWGRGAYNAVI